MKLALVIESAVRAYFVYELFNYIITNQSKKRNCTFENMTAVFCLETYKSQIIENKTFYIFMRFYRHFNMRHVNLLVYVKVVCPCHMS